MNRFLLVTAFTFSSFLSFGQKVNRCVAISVYYHNSDTSNPQFTVPYDTTTMFYTGSRPGKTYWFTNYFNLKYDKQVFISYNSNQESMITYQTFDPRDNVLLQLRILQKTLDSSSKTEYTYTATNDTASLIYYTYTNKNWQPEYKIAYGYNASGQRSSYDYDKWNLPTKAWRNETHTTYVYDGTGRLIESKIGTSRITYNYNTGYTERISDHLLAGNWLYDGKTVYTYNKKLLDSAMVFSWDTSKNDWINTSGEIYTYNDSALIAKRFLLSYANKKRDTSFRENYQYDTSNNLIIYTFEDHTSGAMWRNSNRWDVTYDKHNNQRQLIMSMGNSEGTGWFYNQNSCLISYTFENQDTTLDIKAVNNDIEDIKVYPIPSSNDIINVTAHWKVAQRFSICLYNIQGRIISQWIEEPCSSYSRTIPILSLAKGNYILKMTGQTGSATKQFTVQ